MRWTRSLPIAALLLGLPSCSPATCPLPSDWTLATDLESPNVVVSPKLIWLSKETRLGQWTWPHSTGKDYQALLDELAKVSELAPQPLFLFTFAEGHSCQELTRLRAEIAKAAKCSANGMPCIEGTPDQLP